jgi:hypothetical protein
MVEYKRRYWGGIEIPPLGWGPWRGGKLPPGVTLDMLPKEEQIAMIQRDNEERQRELEAMTTADWIERLEQEREYFRKRIRELDSKNTRLWLSLFVLGLIIVLLILSNYFPRSIG